MLPAKYKQTKKIRCRICGQYISQKTADEHEQHICARCFNEYMEYIDQNKDPIFNDSPICG